MVCKELGLSDMSLRNSVKASAERKFRPADDRVLLPEEMELSSLRDENLKRKREKEILKNSTAYFARDVL